MIEDAALEDERERDKDGQANTLMISVHTVAGFRRQLGAEVDRFTSSSLAPGEEHQRGEGPATVMTLPPYPEVAPESP